MILASRNAGKIRELRELLPGIGLAGLPAEIELPPEDGTTFAENALIKARAARAATGEAVVADDSGLVVDALGGEPGVRSARYAGEEATDAGNLERVLAKLAELDYRTGPERGHRARFVCVIALIEDDGSEHLFEGTCEGRLTPELRGAGGFGYDPAFIPDATGPDDFRTAAELGPDEKNRISHRGRAVRSLVRHLGI